VRNSAVDAQLATSENVVAMIASQTPTELLNTLNADDLRRQLDRLEEERAALLVLLRAARARERKGRERRARTGNE
jgi:hypothetical protein